uniref:Uncharacterized protein n=1 Tax=viral metagenome TaxID=1070528 RepID=A0A6C0HLG1_9ZZZZ
MTDALENQIKAGEWTLFDKVMYGGLGFGSFCVPTNLFKVLFTVIFPPLGEVINIVGDFVIDQFPYITYDSLKAIAENLNRIIYSFVLTSMFYIPGLIYTLSNISCNKQTSNQVIVKPKG